MDNYTEEEIALGSWRGGGKTNLLLAQLKRRIIAQYPWYLRWYIRASIYYTDWKVERELADEP